MFRLRFRPLLAGLAALLVAASGFAATTADRSAFAQGHWWDPSRAGSGMDLFHAGNVAVVTWFTYEESGRPVWYTAQGPLSTLGTESWPLLKHRWQDGRKAGYEVIGSARLSLNHPESARFSFDIAGRQGTWNIQPFIVSGVVNEADHSGHWFDPTNSGWGLAVTQQGDVLGGVLFTYDPSGAPTWAAGFDRQAARSELHTYTGACPWCAYAPSKATSAGQVRFEFASESSLTLRNDLSLAMAAGVNAGGARLVQLSRPASTRPADRQLASFASAAALKAYLAEGVFGLRPSNAGADFSAPLPSSVSFSQTNLQEAEVDEADLVKTNGRLVFSFAPNALGSGRPGVRVAAVSDEGNAFGLRGTVGLTAGQVAYLNQRSGLILHEDRLVAVTGDRLYPYSGWGVSGSFIGAHTFVEVMNTATAEGLPATTWRAQIDGLLVSTRRIGDRVYVVTRFVPNVSGLNYWMGATPSNQAIIDATPLADLLPKVRINGGEAQSLLSLDSVYMPPQGSRRPLADLVVVTAIDLAGPAIAQSLGVIGTVDGIYVSPANLYLATSRVDGRSLTGIMPPREPAVYQTDIHQVRLGADAMTVSGSGSVEGYLAPDLEEVAFRMSEHDGRLRVVSSSTDWWIGTRNRLTILEPSATAPGLLRTLAYLPNAQRPESLGKPGELLYSTRFAGERLYAVTFKKVDPLYVVDLSAPADPRIAGALEIPGFSEYLHPLPNGLLLGFGKDARPASVMGDGSFAWFQGLQLSLYDVSDAANPREMQRALMGKRGSDSPLLRDHHALSTLAQPGGSLSLAFPASIHDGPYPLWGTGDSTFYPWMESGLMRFELRGSTAADARLVQMPSLITHRPPTSAYSTDPVMTARSVLFPRGVVYAGEGQFWHLDAAGTVRGPY
ncbi:MAG: beta-propeller domain-containing protein [Betaproteobacteria bacterium]|nr:beta-propeller domain-containing protein [Betaproteobacteria bacterium]